jgi:hypothetical protein
MAPTNVTSSLAHLAHSPTEPARSAPARIARHGRGARFARVSFAGDLIGLAPLRDDGWLWISARAPGRHNFPSEHVSGFRDSLRGFSLWMVNTRIT